MSIVSGVDPGEKLPPGTSSGHHCLYATWKRCRYIRLLKITSHRMHGLDTAFAKAMNSTDGSFLGSLSEIDDCVIVIMQVRTRLRNLRMFPKTVSCDYGTQPGLWVEQQELETTSGTVAKLLTENLPVWQVLDSQCQLEPLLNQRVQAR